ncbi:WbqC family protein [Marinobacter sp. NFXS9]|uniref:WbqC family protein n=1 Tax=Marinobacter sp. NFXS9 TaxID=2818433 RepID=UPI0032DEC74B
MQPYFLPYVGYFQLLAAVDEFVIYDNVKYTKKGWINRNRILVSGKAMTFSLPLAKDSDKLTIGERKLAGEFSADKFLNQFLGAYRKAPYFEHVFPMLEKIVSFEHRNLFEFILNAVRLVADYIGIDTPITVSSSIPLDEALRGEDRVIGICKARGASEYINPIGGQALYSKQDFASHRISLRFIQSRYQEYVQGDNEFVPWLSIVDVLMHNAPESVSHYVYTGYDLV